MVIRKNESATRATPQPVMRSKVKVIKPGDTVKKEPIKVIGKIRPIDTAIIIKKGKTPEEIRREEARLAKSEIKRNPAFCDCVEMSVYAADTLIFPNYLTYTFTIKNNCKIPIWISTKHFRFEPHNYFGHKVRVKRKLGFVVRHDYKDFEQLAPGNQQSFKYSDDAFYEYAIAKGNTYKFQFLHYNTRERYRNDPTKTFLCVKKDEVTIYVK
ncbi:MAG: hypothetical protein R2800_15195 [Flavipsychrobacter sp.]